MSCGVQNSVLLESPRYIYVDVPPARDDPCYAGRLRESFLATVDDAENPLATHWRVGPAAVLLD